MNAKAATLEGRIRQHWDQLSSYEQRLADVILAAPGQLAMSTATELANSAGVSKATTTRFFRHLGYESYDAARRQAREMQSSGSPLYLQAVPSSSPLVSIIQQHLEKEDKKPITIINVDSLDQTVSTLLTKRADFVYDDISVLAPVAKKYADKVVQVGEVGPSQWMGWATRKEDSSLN